MDSSIAELLAPYPVISKVDVQWADMDRNQHVNNVIYLKYVEISRLDYFEKIGFMDFSGKNPGPIIAETECKYIFPMTYPDTAWMGSRVLQLKDTEFVLETLIVSEKHKRVSSKNESRIVVFDYGLKKKTEMKPSMRKQIEELEGKGFVEV